MKWYKQKSTWVGMSGLVAAIGGFLTGSLDANSALIAAISSLGAVLFPEGKNKGIYFK